MPLKNTITELEQLITFSDKVANNVSTKSVDWHLDHALKVIISVCKTIKNSDPKVYKWKFNAIRTFIFVINYIPRGKGKAPKSVVPPEHIKKENLYLQLEEAKKKLLSIENLDSNSNFKHPYFGMLDLKMTKRFLKLHTRHHLKICNDIIKG